MRFVCDSCRAQYMISDDKVGVKGVKVRCKKCGYVILVRRAAANAADAAPPPSSDSPGAAASSLPFDSEEGAGSAGDPDSGSAGDAAPAEGEAASGTAQSALSGIQDDEIGAVFDQVLKSGPHKIEEKPSINSLAPPPDDEDLSLGMDDDLASTRAVSTDALKKLVAEAEAQATGGSGPKNATSIPNDWFVAIDDAQQGPLTVDRVRDLWNQGEIGPDSLAWRAGMADWVPLSEITELASELAPKPSKPLVAAPATSQVGTVVSAQGESSFALGGASRGARSEPFGSSAASSEPPADTGGWKPSAASALAALVSEEMSALSNKPKPRSLLESGPSDRPHLSDLPAPSAARPVGMFDIPSAPHEVLSAQPQGKQSSSEAPAGMALTQSPNQPYTGPSVYGGASYPSYASPPPSGGMSGAVKAGIGIAAALVLLLGGAVVFLLGRSPEAPVTPPAAVVEAAPVAPVTPPPAAPTQVAAAVPMPPPPAGMVEKPGEVAPEPLTQPSKPEPVAAAAPSKPEPTAARTEPSPRPVRRTPTSGEDDGAIVARATKPTPPPPTSGGEDDFDALFAADKPKPAEGGTKPKRQPGYIPPPVASDVQESLSESDIMGVVVAHKSDIVRCVNEMKAKEPGISGRLVMRWTIRPAGSTTGISAQTAEFKNSHMAKCIGGLVKTWKFPRHRVQGDPINFPFVF